MSTRLTSAIVLGLAIVTGPMAGASAWAQTPPAATSASLQPVIAAAARKAASTPGFAALSAQAKLAAIQAEVSAALAESGASPTVIANALIQAVSSGTISAGVAIQVASVVAPQMAQTVAQAPAVQQQLAQTGQTASVSATASTEGGAPVSVLVSLQGASTPGGGGTEAGTGTTTPAPYDPCAGVVAAYCGS